MTRIARRISLCLLLAALMALAGCERSREAPPAPIRIGAYYWPGQYWMDIAHRKGWFREAGLNVEWVDTNADYFASFDQLVEGKLDIVNMSQFDFVLYNARGKPLVAFVASDYTTGAEALVAQRGIGTVRELAGKRLALSKGTYLEFIWTVIAERAKLAPASVEIVDAAPERAHDLLAKGQVDAILTWGPFVTSALASAKGVKLIDTSALPGVAWSLLATRPEFASKRSAELQKFVRVWERTTLFIQQRPDEALAIVAEVNRKSPAEVRDFLAQDRVLDVRDNVVAFSYAGGFESLHGSTRRMLDFMLARELAPGRPETGALFDERFVRALAEPEAAK